MCTHLHEAAWAVYDYSWRGLEQRRISAQNWGKGWQEPKLQLTEVMRVRKGQEHLSLGSSWSCGWGIKAEGGVLEFYKRAQSASGSCLLWKQNWESFSFFPFIFISWRLITLQYCSGFCHTLTWIRHGFTCVPHPNLPHLPLQLILLGLPTAPGPSTCLMHPTWAADLFHPW